MELKLSNRLSLAAVFWAVLPLSAATADPPPQTGLQFNGTGAYVDMDRAAGLGSSTFTLECWFKMLGAGTEASSGFGGVTGVPLICKGRGQAVSDPRDGNYFFAVRLSDRVLVADFNDTATGGLHPVAGTTHITENMWCHGAATYDGTTWRLYLNGQLEAEAAVNATPQSASPQHFGLGSALDAAGLPLGMFNGLLDEVRVWNYARSQAQIQADMNVELPPTAGLVGHWSLNEAGGDFAGDTGTAGSMGTIYGAAWSPGVSFPAALRVSTLAPSTVTVSTATLNGVLADLGDATSAQVYFRWGTSPGSLTQTTSPVTLTAPGAFQQPLAGLTVGTTGYYRAVAVAGGVTVEGAIFPFLAVSNAGLQLNGSTDYVSMGQAPGLGLAVFTLECWFKRIGTGQLASTGDGGIEAVPLITKGRDETEGGYRDCNYFLGISTDGVLAADFEEAGGANHPAEGTTLVSSGVWHHAAATYDGATLRVYLDGHLEAEVFAGAAPLYTSIHHFGLGAALNTSGTPEGYFDGVLDEVRIWNYARSRAEIVADVNREVPAAPGLIARWGLNEGIGSGVDDSSGSGFTGSIASGTWAGGTSFRLNVPPDTPSPISPPDGAHVAAANLGNMRLTVRVSDPESQPLSVKFFGRTMPGVLPPPFRIVALPDTQHYSTSYPATFNAQTRWIVNHHQDMNIVYAAHEGDIVNNATITAQWQNANTAISILDTVPQLPFGLAVGNHDQDPNGNPDGTGAFNQRFPYTRYQSRPWYGGHYSTNNDSHYILFSSGNLDFIAIHMEYDTTPASGLLSWAGNLLKNNPTRRGIVVAHSILNTGADWTTQGAVIYDNLKNNPNLFLMLCGHIAGESRRTDYNAGTVHTLLSDFQKRDNGGNGWLRILEFSPVENVIRVKTYSPTLDQYETDANSQFTLAYDMGGESFAEIGQVTTTPGQTEASISWNDCAPGSQCEWYATASDGQTLVTSPAWDFTIGTPVLDLNGDGSIDPADAGLFEACLTGPGVSYRPTLPPGCLLSVGTDGKLAADWDKDADLDQEDFAMLQRCYVQAGQSVDPVCLE